MTEVRWNEMTKFVVLYYAPASAMEQMKNVTPEQAKEGMRPWMDWAEKCGDNLLDLGSPLGNGQAITKMTSAPSKKNVIGYSMLQAENMNAAKKLLNGHPHLAWADGCEIEVHECLPLPGQ